MTKRKALTVIDGSVKELPTVDILEQEDRIPLDDRSVTPLDVNHRIPTYGEQLMGFSKQDMSILFIDKLNGFLTRRLNTTLTGSGAGNAFALSTKNVLFHSQLRAGNPEFSRVDPASGESTFLLNLTYPGTVSSPAAGGRTPAMDFHPETNIPYTILFDVSDFDPHLLTIDVLTGVVTDIGRFNILDHADGLAIDPTDPTKVFALVDNAAVGASGKNKADLYSVNILTGNATLVGDTLHDRASSIAFDAAGILYAVLTERVASVRQKLYTLNTGTGAGTEVGQLFYEEQFPGASNHSVTDITFRRLSTAASEFSFPQHGALNLVHEYGVVNAYKVAQHPNPTSLIDGQEFNFITTIANTGAVTLDYNNKGAEALVNRDGTALTTGDILADVPYRIQRDQANTRWKLLNPGS